MGIQDINALASIYCIVVFSDGWYHIRPFFYINDYMYYDLYKIKDTSLINWSDYNKLDL